MWLDWYPDLSEDDEMRCVTSDGWVVVEVATRSCAGPGSSGEWIRIKRGAYHYADVRSIRELVAQLAGLGLDLAELKEAD